MAISVIRDAAEPQGTWKGNRGAHGRGIAGVGISLPAYMTNYTNDAGIYTFEESPSLPEAVQKPDPATDRIISRWQASNTITMAFDLSQAARFSVYIVTYNMDGFRARVDLRNRATQAIILQHTVAGEYRFGRWITLEFDAGSYTLQIVKTAGDSVYASAWMVDPIPTEAPPVSPFAGIANLLADFAANQITGIADGAKAITFPDMVGVRQGSQPTEANKATYIADALNGRPALRFSSAASQSYYGLSLSLPGDFTVMALHKTSNDHVALGWLQPGVTTRQLRKGQSGNNVLSAFDGSLNPISPALGLPRTDWVIDIWRRTGGTMAFFQKGIAAGNVVAQGSGPFTTNALPLDHLDGIPSQALFTEGDVMRRLVWNRALTTSELQSAADTLAALALPANAAPDAPTVTVDQITATSARLTASAYSDPESNPQASREFRVRRTTDNAILYGPVALAAGTTQHTATGLPSSTANLVGEARDSDGSLWGSWGTSAPFATLAPNIAPVAAFSYLPAEPTVGGPLQFTNLSTIDPGCAGGA